MVKVQQNNSAITVKVQPTQAIQVYSALNMHDNTDFLSAGVARDWAIKTDGIVCGEDYSSKYYAQKAKQSEETAKSYLDEAVYTITDGMPTATSEHIGGVKIGANLQITDDGTISRTLNANWGLIQGTISAQSDLITALQAKTNIDLNNLSSEGLNLINSSKALKTGNFITNTDILSEVISYAHSTFCGYQSSAASPLDLKKFVVINNAVITNDGVANGFTAIAVPTSGLNVPDVVTSFSMHFEFYPKTDTNNWVCYADQSQATGGVISCYQSVQSELIYGAQYKVYNPNTQTTESLTWDISNIGLTKQEGVIKVDINWDGTTHTITMTQPATNRSYTKKATSSLAPDFTRNYFVNFGAAIKTINLKNVSIKINGVPVFNGNKTGIDTIKADDYTKVGSPTISADGVASGFSGANYIEKLLSLTPASSVKFRMKFKTGNSVSPSQFIFQVKNTAGTQYIDVGIVSANSLRFRAVTNLNYTYSYTISANTEYYAEIEYTGSEYIARLSTDGQNWDEHQIGTNNLISAIDDLLIGQVNSNVWGGSFDLNCLETYVDGSLVYQPCLKIPYTESKTGSKVVDSVYRDRVSDMASQFGYAPYYTLSDTDFTLPMGEIYGMIERKADTINVTALNQAKADKDLSNTIPALSVKKNIVSWFLPDYTNKIAIAQTTITGAGYTAPNHGWFIGMILPYNNTELLVNDISIGIPYYNQSDGTYLLTIPLSKDDVFKITGTITFFKTAYFIPCKGVS